MNRSRTVQTIAASLLAISMTLSVLLARSLDRINTTQTLEESVLVRSPALVKFFSLGFNGLAASLYWTRAVQYFGRKHHDYATRFDLLSPLLDMTTALDPHLTVAYEFGGIFLAQRPPEGAGDPDAAVRLVEQGIKENPDQWKLYYHLGFIHYLERHDVKAAADAFERGSQVPGAHPWMKIMAAMLLERGGDVQTSRYLWSRIFESTEDPLIKHNAYIRLLALKVDEQVGALEQAVHTYKQRTGMDPTSWMDLVRERMLPRIPADPLGLPYILAANGRVEIQDYKRFPFVTKGLPPGVEPIEMMTGEEPQLPGEVTPKKPEVKPSSKVAKPH